MINYFFIEFKYKKTRNIIFLYILLVLLYISISSADAKKGTSDIKLFIKNPEIKTGISAQFSADFTKRLTLHFFEAGGYRVLDENDIKIIYQEAEQLLALGCDADQCIMQIAHAINADEVVYGTIEKPAEKIHLYIQLLKKDVKTNKMAKQSIIDVSFFESQTDWYADEIVKKLINPDYVIDNSKASFEVKIIPKLEPITLKEIKQDEIKPITFKIDDDTVNMIVNVIKNILINGDTLINQNEYSAAILKYEDAISRIETKVTNNKQVKLISLKNDIFSRIANVYKMIFRDQLKISDDLLTQYNYSDAEKEYQDIIDKISSLRQEIKNLIKPYKNQVEERLKIAKKGNVKSLIKEGDLNYNEYRFREAVSLYEKALKKLKEINISTIKNEMQHNLENKIKIAQNTEREYLKNKVKIYCDKIEVYNIKNENEEAINIFKELKSFIGKNPQGFEYTEIKSLYNEIKKIMENSMLSDEETLGKYVIIEPINGQQVVFDMETNLMWVRDGNLAGEGMKWDDAMNFCKNLNYAGYDDWRLPAIEELSTLIKKDERPTINNKVFDCKDRSYWSSTPMFDSNDVCDVHFGGNDMGNNNKADNNYVRPVRGRQ